MKTFARIAYFIMGVVQFFAIWDGAMVGLGVGSFLGLIVALVLAGMPLIGSGFGMYGAVVAWHWGTLQAFLLFFWYIPFVIGVYAYAWWSARKGD